MSCPQENPTFPLMWRLLSSLATEGRCEGNVRKTSSAVKLFVSQIFINVIYPRRPAQKALDEDSSSADGGSWNVARSPSDLCGRPLTWGVMSRYLLWLFLTTGHCRRTDGTYGLVKIPEATLAAAALWRTRSCEAGLWEWYRRMVRSFVPDRICGFRVPT